MINILEVDFLVKTQSFRSVLINKGYQYCDICHISQFFIGIIGGTPDKRISEALFCFFWIIVFIYFVQFIFSGVFISIIGGTPDKRISEGLF